MGKNAVEQKVVFMGTPQFAVPSLRAISVGPYMITVVTQPDRPAGRHSRLTPPPVKTAALELGLPVWQPETLKDPEFRAKLAELRPDVTVLVAYGEYLAPTLLDLPRTGSINLHPSLLPRFRGSTPVQSPILEGDPVTGVSIIKMDKGLDTGPIIAQRTIGIEPGENAAELGDRLAHLGAELLAEVLPVWLRGDITPQPQDEARATLTSQLKKEDGLINWSSPAGEIERRVRAFQPWPGTYTHWQGRTLKIIAAQAREEEPQESRAPGTVFVEAGPGGKTLWVAAGRGALELLKVQVEGKPVIEARALLSGYPQIVGSVLESA